MTPEEYQWHINLVKDRNPTLDLSSEQAEKIYKYEQDKDTYSNKHHFSVWEEWDYEKTTYREILNDLQYYNYENLLKENIERYTQSLLKQDNEMLNDILFHEELLSFYENQYLPDLFKNPFIDFVWLQSEKSKIEYLRKEYKRYLNDTKKEILIHHFRHNRTLRPNELKLSLLHLKLNYIFPNYSYFKQAMDEPTKAVANYLKTMVRHLPKQLEDLFFEKNKELKKFNEEHFEKRYSERKGGWSTVVGHLTDEEEKVHRSMTLLLLDREKYGW